MNVNPRKDKAGRQASVDHFRFEAEDVERVLAKLREKYPDINVLKRPGSREFAGIITHDLAGNVFDLSQPGMENRRDFYVEEERFCISTCLRKLLALRRVLSAKLAQNHADEFLLERSTQKLGQTKLPLESGPLAQPRDLDAFRLVNFGYTPW